MGSSTMYDSCCTATCGVVLSFLSIETIDLSSTEGNLKHLWSHLSDNAATFFELRELCIVVKVQVSTGMYVHWCIKIHAEVLH